MVVVPAEALARFERFSLYNSPYPAHDRGRAVDLYPSGPVAPSPVAGTVRETHTVGCPRRPYGSAEDHLIVLDTGSRLARVLHVDPAVVPGEEVAVGDPLGDLVRSGFFARWVDNHVHLEFRERDADPLRASGALPLEVDVPVAGAPWDGRGVVVETGPTHAVLDAPAHPEPGTWTGLAADDGRVLDGGLVHYAGGGALCPRRGRSAGGARTPGGARSAAPPAETAPTERPVSLLGRRVGAARGRDVAWADVGVWAGGVRATGLSLAVSRTRLGATLVFREGHPLSVGEAVDVTVRPVEDPVRLG